MASASLTDRAGHLIGNPKERPLVALRTVFGSNRRIKAPLLKELVPWAEDAQESLRFAYSHSKKSLMRSRSVMGQCSIVSSPSAYFGRSFNATVWRLGAKNMDGAYEAISMPCQFETCFSVADFAADAGHHVAEVEMAGKPSFQCGTRSSTPPSIETPSQRLRDGWNWEDALGDRQQYGGKSTFLRTVGVNVRLALAGAPVCAAERR